MTGGAPTIGGLKRLDDQIGGDDRWDVLITGGEISGVTITNSTIDGTTAVNVFTPEQFGAKGDAVGNQQGVISGPLFNQFSSPAYTFTQANVGKFIWFDQTDRVIVSVAAGVATFSPAASGTQSNVLWLSGTDDTVAIQQALDAARNVQGSDLVENAGSTDGLIISGGVCQLTAGKSYIIYNSQSDYSGGKLSALVVYRRTDFVGTGLNDNRSSLCLRPNSYGHMISNSNPGTAFVDFVGIGNMTLYGYRDWSPNALNGLHWHVAFNGYDAVDTFNRFYDINVKRAKQDGFYFRGRGGIIIENCSSTYSGRYGYYFQNQVDYKVIGCDAAGNSKTGIRVQSSANGQWTNCKSFYSGSSGGTVDGDCANWHITADQLRNGLCFFDNCMAQESRGSGWVIENSGLNTFSNCQSMDPGREGLNSGTLPAVVSGVYIKGGGSSENTFSNFYIGPSVAIFSATNNWGLATDALYVDGVNGSGYGPQQNRGDFWTYVATIKSDGTLDPGTNYRPGFGPIGGAGTTNGRNFNTYMNNVRFVNTVADAPVNLAATPVNNGCILNWSQYFSGGSIAVTDYVVEYKLTSNPTWTTFAHAPITSGPITVTGLTNSLFYDFRVAAVNSVGTGPYATITNVQIIVTAPAQVTGLVATPGFGFVGLSWTAPFNGNSPITDYLIEYKQTASPTWLTLGHAVSAATTQYLIDASAVSYDFRVSAINAVGTGAVSAVSSATPTAALCNFDASNAASISASGGVVGSITDISGNGYVASQATLANRPSTGVATIGSLNALRFDGTNDYLQASLSSSGFLSGQDYALQFCVMRLSGSGSFNVAASCLTNVVGTGADRMMEMGGNAGRMQAVGRMLPTDSQWIMTSTGTMTGTATLSATRVRRNATPVMYSSFLPAPISSGIPVSNNSFTTTNNQAITLGSYKLDFGFFPGDLGQYVVYGGDISIAQMNGIGRALAYKWGLTWTDA